MTNLTFCYVIAIEVINVYLFKNEMCSGFMPPYCGFGHALRLMFVNQNHDWVHNYESAICLNLWM